MPFEKGKIPEGAKPFQPGQSGNPSGRPKKLDALDVMLDNILGEEKDGVSAVEAIFMALRSKAAKGDIRAAEVLLDRFYGKPKQFLQADLRLTQVNLQIVRDKPSTEVELPASGATNGTG